MKIIVIGAGVIGATSAYWLARAGHDVTVMDEAPAPGQGTSAGNGGQLAYAYVEPMAGPEIWRSLPSILLGRDRGIRIRLAFELGFLSWVFRFLLRCRESALNSALIDLLDLSRESERAMDWLLSQEMLEFAYRPAGKLILYRDKAGLDLAARLAERKRAQGFKLEILDEVACRVSEPAIDQCPGPIAGALYSPEDAVGDCAAFTRSLMVANRSRHGVNMQVSSLVSGFVGDANRIRGVVTNAGNHEADAVVLAAGTGSVGLAASLGITLPIYPVKGYSLTAPVGRLAPNISLTDRSARLLIARLGNEVRVAGLADLDGWHDRPEPRRIAELRVQAERLFPHAGQWENAKPAWMGRRPMTPDGMPRIGASPIPGLFLNVGHGALGWTFACGSAARLARVIGPA